jgi:hypothetical protein
MYKVALCSAFILLASCSRDGIECDNESIKKAVVKKIGETLTETLSAESVDVVKIDSISTTGSKSETGKNCQADILIKVKKSKYNADYDVKLG